MFWLQILVQSRASWARAFSWELLQNAKIKQINHPWIGFEVIFQQPVLSFQKINPTFEHQQGNPHLEGGRSWSYDIENARIGWSVQAEYNPNSLLYLLVTQPVSQSHKTWEIADRQCKSPIDDQNIRFTVYDVSLYKTVETQKCPKVYGWIWKVE